MKSLSKYLALLAAVAGLATVTARAEGDKPAPKPEAPKHERGSRPNLSDEEKAKIKAAREAAEKDPAVIAAKEAMKQAREKAKESKDREPVRAAEKALRDAFKAAMLKADPSLAALLEKYPMLAAPMGGRGEGRGERGPKPGKGGDKPAPAPAKPAGE